MGLSHALDAARVGPVEKWRLQSKGREGIEEAGLRPRENEGREARGPGSGSQRWLFTARGSSRVQEALLGEALKELLLGPFELVIVFAI